MAKAIRITRPQAADVRHWHDLTMQVLNMLKVQIGQDFVIATVRNPDEKAGIALDTGTGQLTTQVEERHVLRSKPRSQQQASAPAAAAPKETDSNEMGGFSKDSETSRKAALDNYPRSGSQRHRVLLALASAENKGMTRDELAQKLSLPDSSVDGRCWELIRGEWAVKTGETRKTQHGSDADVLTLTQKGWDAVRQKERHVRLAEPGEESLF